MTDWMVYIIQGRDGTLYTGITTNIERRIHRHNHGSTTRFTRSRRPWAVVYQEPAKDRSAALKQEAAIKRLRRADKLLIIGK